MALTLPSPSQLVSWSVRTVTTVASVPGRVLALLTAVEAVVARAEDLVSRTERVVGESEEAVTRVRRVTTESADLVSAARPLLQFVEEFSAHELTAAIKLVDELPRLSRHLTDDVLPVLGTLRQVGPDLHQLLEVANDVRQAVLGIPGFEYLRRRGEDKEEERGD
jgi:hypothetical protein